MTDIYDTLIIGSGPGGLSAAIYAGRAGLHTLLIEKAHIGGRINDTAEICNYPGILTDSGEGLIRRFKKHVESFPSVQFLRSTTIEIRRQGDIFEVVTKRKGSLFTRSVVLASGNRPRSSGIAAELTFAGRGVSYCATCDGEFFKGKAIHVLGAGDQAIEEADWLTRYARKVTVIVIHEENHLDCNQLAFDKAMSNPRIEFVWNSTLHDIKGRERVESLVLENVHTGERRTVPSEGIFLFIGTLPQNEYIPGWIAHNRHGYILTNTRMETNVPGVYAVGDLRNTPLRQVITAAADGAIAAVNAEHYLQEASEMTSLLTSHHGMLSVIFWDPYDFAQQQLLPAVEQTLKKTGHVQRIDVTRHDLLLRQLGLTTTPALARYRDGQLLNVEIIPLPVSVSINA
jgi:thioredoxin reductase (NADPH)